MRLTRYTDYAMRVLLHLAARDDGDLSSIGEIAGLYKISQNHLMKVVQDLGKAGFVRTVRGRGGGIALARPADQIIVGQVVRQTEEGFQLVDCAGCVIAPACTLPRVAQRGDGGVHRGARQVQPGRPAGPAPPDAGAVRDHRSRRPPA
jgi:Rrf2 family nitric oxide-sensitive transcriptional repressor